MVAGDVEDFVRLMAWGGFWVKRSWSGRLQLSRVVFFTVVAVASGASLFVAGRVKIVETSYFFVQGSMMGLQSLVQFSKLGQVEALVGELKEVRGRHSGGWRTAALASDSEKAWRAVFRYGRIISLFTLFYLICSVALDSWSAWTGRPSPYTLPLPLARYLLSIDNRTSLFWLLTFASLVWSILSLAHNFSLIGGFLVLIGYVVVEIKILRRSLREIFREPHGALSLRDLVRSHQDIIRLSKMIKQYTGLSFAIQHWTGSISICLSLYTAAKGMHKDPVLTAVNASMTLVWVGCISLSLLLGEYLQNENMAIFNALYNTPWYDMTPRRRRDIAFMMLQTSRPLEINFKGRSRLNAETLIQILNASYSYFTLLQSIG